MVKKKKSEKEGKKEWKLLPRPPPAAEEKSNRKTHFTSNLLPVFVFHSLSQHTEPAIGTREIDLLVFGLLSERALAPKLLGFFPEGRLEEYLEGRTITVCLCFFFHMR